MVNLRRLQRLGAYLRPHWKKVLLGIFALLVVNAVNVWIGLLVGDTIDTLRQSFSFEQLWGFVPLILALASLMWLIRMSSRILLFGVGREVEFDLKQEIFQHLLFLEPAFFTTNTSGDLISRATSDVDNVRALLGFAVLSLVNTVFAYTITLPVMLTLDASLSVKAIAIYPLMLISIQLFSGKLRDQQREVQEQLAHLSELIQEDISGIALIKIYAQETNERRAFANINRQLLTANLKLARTRNILFPFVEGLSSISLLVLLALGARAIAAGEITPGDFVTLIFLTSSLVFPTALLGFTITRYQRGEVSIDRIESILQVQPQIQDRANAVSLVPETVKGKLSAHDLSYTYPGTPTPALDRISFTIFPGETVAVVGPIGAGKSTLANALPRLLNIEEGQLFLDNIDITKLRLQDLRQAIAYVPQDSFLFSTTIKNNIRYGDPLRESPDISEASQQAQIHPEILNFPQQYETLVGERGITLSGGQRQRTSLARALLVDAAILILDDALSSVDNQTATQILRNLSSGVHRKTVIFITHQLAAAATADRILVMERGKIVQSGTHDQLLEESGLYRSLWQQHQLEEVLQ
ncbi:MAG: ABC transporter ATP-binding protein [Cyanophyceae cyanobacterium]